MKYSNFRAISLMFVIIFVFSILAGCGNISTEKYDGNTIQASTEKAAEKKEPDLLKIYIKEIYAGVPLNKEMISYMEEKTNTKLDFTVIPGDQLEEKLNLMLGSGERPDVIQFYNDDFELRYVDAGMLMPLNDLLDKAPNLKKNWGDICWNAMKHSDGIIYAIPYKGSTVDFTIMYRKDWLDKLGMKIPTTIDEYYDVAVAMSKGDPDGNGKNDTYALGNCDGFGDYRNFDHIFGAYGTLDRQWLEVDGRIVNGSVLPAAKEALKMMKKLYDAGAIDPEFITDNWDRSDQKVQKGIYGATCNYMFILSPISGYYQNIKKNCPTAEYVQGPLLTSTYTTKNLGMRILPQRGWLKTSILKGSKNAEACMRLFDWLASDEGSKFSSYGFKDRNYTEDAGGHVTLVTPQSDNQKNGIMQMYLIMRNISNHYPEVFVKAKEVAEATGVPSAIDGILVPETAKYSNDLEKFTREQFSKMTVGEIAIDGGFEKFVEDWNSRGGKEWTDALNKAK